MTDDEIIKCLKYCRAGDCEGCKVLDVCDATFSFHKDAVDLINRQKAEIERLRTIRTPKKPTTHDEEYYFCPHCKEELSVTGEDMYIYDITPPKYCCHCGQALDWSDEE